MEELGREELVQLVAFYRQKSSDLEFSLLQTQLKLNKAMFVSGQEQPVPAIKTVIDRKQKSE